ncbi:MAG: hypothetical protein AAGE03_10095, partial [Pseudomonadota bacterium]
MTSKTVIDFNLDAGTIVRDQYADQGLRIFSLKPHSWKIADDNPAMIFDAEQDPNGHVSGGDDDLLFAGQGGVLIASEDGDQSDPDDNAGGAKFLFKFDEPVTVDSLKVLDVEHGSWIKLFDEHGRQIGQFDAFTADNGAKTVHIGVENVAFMTVEIRGSGAVDDLVFTPPAAPDGVVDGTEGDDLIDLAFVDAHGDR